MKVKRKYGPIANTVALSLSIFNIVTCNDILWLFIVNIVIAAVNFIYLSYWGYQFCKQLISIFLYGYINTRKRIIKYWNEKI